MPVIHPTESIGMTVRISRAAPSTVQLYLGRSAVAGMDVDGIIDPPPWRRSRARTPANRRVPVAGRGELAGFVHVRHAGRDYCGWYRVAGDLLTVFCGVAANTGLLPDRSQSLKPLAERLLHELVDAENPGINPE
ncbi:MAG: hypothetical protein ABIS17_02355 [Casimicrobiaceae bacterium]